MQKAIYVISAKRRESFNDVDYFKVSQVGYSNLFDAIRYIESRSDEPTKYINNYMYVGNDYLYKIDEIYVDFGER